MIPVLAIPVLNRYDLLDQNLDLIDYPIKEILIINNGKEEYVPKRKDLNIRVLNLPSNLGMSGSWNLTIKLYPHEKFWMFSSADTHWLPGSLQKMHDLSGESKIMCSSEGFSCFSVGENVVRHIGLFDEKFYPYVLEDDDYRERLLRHNKEKKTPKLEFINRAFEVSIPHGQSQTILSDPVLLARSQETYHKNKKYLELKRSQGFKIMGNWDLDVRRDQEWL